MVPESASPAARAFDAVAESFDDRYGAWLSVAAQRRAVRSALVDAFPPGAKLLEIGGGTGDDAVWLTEQGREVLLTDASPAMVGIARGKLGERGQAAVLAAEDLETLADRREQAGEAAFDGAYSNFAALNCVADLAPVGRALARLVRPGGAALLVVFGPLPPGEIAVQLARGDPRSAFRRLSRGDVPARLGGRDFVVRYHRPRDIRRAMSPWFRLTDTRGIGVFVPPSAAEPWISRHPRLLRALERLDRVASGPLALLGDHVLYGLVRSDVPVRASGPGSTAAEVHPSAAGAPTPRSEVVLPDADRPAAKFRAEYAAHRAAEGRGHTPAELALLPYLTTGPLARQWRVRARTYDAFVRRVLEPLARARGRPLDLLDLGAGNGWLCSRAARAGHHPVALDIRSDEVDGLGAARWYLEAESGGKRFGRVAASFEALPLADAGFDVVVFNAALHYAPDLGRTLAEARRALRAGGRLVILDSPFYRRVVDGEAMVAEKHREAAARFGPRAEALLALPFIEYLTAGRLREASAGLGLEWRRHRVRYPLWYEIRPLVARLRRRRPPSRFDLWEGAVR